MSIVTATVAQAAHGKDVENAVSPANTITKHIEPGPKSEIARLSPSRHLNPQPNTRHDIQSVVIPDDPEQRKKRGVTLGRIEEAFRKAGHEPTGDPLSDYIEFMQSGKWDAGLMYSCLLLQADCNWTALAEVIDIKPPQLRRHVRKANPPIKNYHLEQISANFGLPLSLMVFHNSAYDPTMSLEARKLMLDEGRARGMFGVNTKPNSPSPTRVTILRDIALPLSGFDQANSVDRAQRKELVEYHAQVESRIYPGVADRFDTIFYYQQDQSMVALDADKKVVPKDSLTEIALVRDAEIPSGSIVLAQIAPRGSTKTPPARLYYYERSQSDGDVFESYTVMNRPMASVIEDGDGMPSRTSMNRAPSDILHYRRGTDDEPLDRQRFLIGKAISARQNLEHDTLEQGFLLGK